MKIFSRFKSSMPNMIRTLPTQILLNIFSWISSTYFIFRSHTITIFQFNSSLEPRPSTIHKQIWFNHTVAVYSWFIANNFVIGFYCRCLEILCQIAFSSIANYFRFYRKKQFGIESVGIYSRNLHWELLKGKIRSS